MRTCRTLLSLSLLLALASVCFAQSAGPDVPALQEAAHFRNAAMCGYLAADGDQWAAVYAQPNSAPRLFDAIYASWPHAIGRLRSEHDRAEWFYRALSALVKLQANLVADPQSGEISYLPDSVAVLLGKVGADDRAQSLSALAAGNPELQGVRLKACLLANSASVQKALALSQDLTALAGLSALNADQRTLFAAVPVASQESIDMLDALKASTHDPDVVTACDRLRKELESGRTDFVARAIALLKEGNLANNVLQRALKLGATEGLEALLGCMGVSAGAAAATVVGVAASGIQAALVLTGEDQAFEHARLAHFAGLLLPDLCAGWSRLRPTAAPDQPDACAALDATSRALLLVEAFENTEEGAIHSAYDKGLLTHLNLTTPAAGWPPVTDNPYPFLYRQWRSGALFTDYAPALPSPQAAAGEGADNLH